MVPECHELLFSASEQLKAYLESDDTIDIGGQCKKRLRAVLAGLGVTLRRLFASRRVVGGRRARQVLPWTVAMPAG